MISVSEFPNQNTHLGPLQPEASPERRHTRGQYTSWLYLRSLNTYISFSSQLKRCMGRNYGVRETHIGDAVPALDNHVIYQEKQDVTLSVCQGRQTKPHLNFSTQRRRLEIAMLFRSFWNPGGKDQAVPTLNTGGPEQKNVELLDVRVFSWTQMLAWCVQHAPEHVLKEHMVTCGSRHPSLAWDTPTEAQDTRTAFKWLFCNTRANPAYLGYSRGTAVSPWPGWASPHLQGGGIKLPTLKCGLPTVTSFQRGQSGKGRRVTLQWRN